MIEPPIGNQRWRERKAFFRRPDEQINTLRYDVVPIPSDNVAKGFVQTHHYSGTYPAARYRTGLYRSGNLVGVAVFSVPPRNIVLTKCFTGVDPSDAVELGRLVLLDDVPGNGETFYLGQSFRLIREQLGMRGVVSFSDPVPRNDEHGQTVFLGHMGTIYQAFNGRYTGRGKARTLLLLPDGRIFSERALSKIHSLDRGYVYAVDQLRRHGAGVFDERDPRGWLATWIPRITRRLRHPGNHRYIWALDKRLRKYMLPALPYPKRDAVRAA